MLGLERRVAEGDRLIRQGGWTGFRFDFLLGSDLAGKRLGIIGMGRIGQAVARRAGAFGMEVVYMPSSRKRKRPAPGRFDGGLRAQPMTRLATTNTKSTRESCASAFSKAT